MREIKGSSGAHIIINAAPFAVVKRLRRCFAEEFRRISIDIGNPGSLAEIKEEFGNNVSKYLNNLKDIILGLETSQEFENVMWDCLRDCLYDNKAITPTLFDDLPTVRDDYDLIVFECIKENLSPFFKSLGGLLSIHNGSSEIVQK